MLEKLISGMVNVEQMAHDKIQDALEKIALEELKCDSREMFIMIKPMDASFEPGFYIYRLQPGKGPSLHREIKLSEILSASDE